MKQRWNKVKLESLLRKENKNKIYQHLWDIAKAVFNGKFIEMNAYIKKENSSHQLPNLSL